MEQAQATLRANDSPLNTKGLCLLSLDGGGVRGLSSLLILKALMANVNTERVKDGKKAIKPCELFDMIGGTSTGGIISIMLGRLEMDVDECIDAYTTMFTRIFGKKGLPVNMFGNVKGRFDSVVLEECIKDILRKRGIAHNEPLDNPQKDACKVIVCAKAAEIGSTVLIRSYQSKDALNNIPATICEAARATSAASTFFEPVKIGPRGRTFVDGALGANNPVEQVWNEAQNEWCDNTQPLVDLVKCFVSIGTGNPGLKSIDEGVAKFFTKTLVSIATETEDTAKIFASRHRILYESKRYFRFNVEQGLQGVGLEEYKKEALIDSATSEYMNLQEIKSAAQHCAQNLKQKEYLLHTCVREIIEWNRAELLEVRDARKSISLMPFPRNQNFVDREDIFSRLVDLLPFDQFQEAAICGLGGCGKTQIALEYAYRRQEEIGCSLFWIRGDSEASFTKSCNEIAVIAGLDVKLAREELLQAVKLWIERQKNWLLILDNVDDTTVFKLNYSSVTEGQPSGSELIRFVPKVTNGSTGAILWTSRDYNIIEIIVGIGRGISIDVMTETEAITLLYQMCGASASATNTHNGSQLVKALDNLPLAVAQAAAYIRKTRISIHKYIKILAESESRQTSLLNHDFEDTYRSGVPNSVMRTWNISIEHIAQEYPDVRNVLGILAFYDPQGIPFNLVQAAAGTEATGDEDSSVVFASEDEVLLLAGRLVDYSIFQTQQATDDGLPTYQQHRLVQLSTRASLDMTQTEALVVKALEIITTVFPGGKVEFETWGVCKSLLPHVLKVLEWARSEECDISKSALLRNMAIYYWHQGQYVKAEQFQQQVVDLQRSLLGEEHVDTITAMDFLSTTWQNLGRYDNAVEQLQVHVVTNLKAILGEKHVGTIRGMENLAALWRMQDRLDEAEQLDLQVLKLRKTILGERHPDTINAIANLSATYYQQGRADEAEQLDLQVLKLRKTILGERHPTTIMAVANLAATYHQQGRTAEAEQLNLQVLKLRKSILGERHPDTIKTIANLAATYHQQGRADEAEQLDFQVLKLRKTILGESHPDTIQAMWNLSMTLWRQGVSGKAEGLSDAELLLKQVVDSRKTVLGEEHPDTIKAIKTLERVGLLLSEAGDTEDNHGLVNRQETSTEPTNDSLPQI